MPVDDSIQNNLVFCERCQQIQTGSIIKIVWKYQYAQISSIEISHRSKEAPLAYCCSKDGLTSGCPKAAVEFLQDKVADNSKRCVWEVFKED